MNIGVVGAWGERGAGYVTRQYVAALRAQGANVTVLAPLQRAQRERAWLDDNVTYCKPTWLARNDGSRRSFVRWVESGELSAVIFNELRDWRMLTWARAMGILTIAYVDYYTEDSLPLFSAYDLVLCNTERHFGTFSWHPGARKIPWGTDVSVFQPVPSPASSEPLRFFHSCGVSPERKGTEAAILAVMNVTSDVTLTIHTQVELRSHLSSEGAAALEHGLRSSRILVRTGTVPAPGLYHLGDVYLYPTSLEGVGLTVPEALACGLPCIVPDEPPMTEFLSPACKRIPVLERTTRSDAYYWPRVHVSPLDVASAMDSYAAAPLADRGRWRQIARRHAESRLDWRRNSSSLLRLIEEAEIQDPGSSSLTELDRRVRRDALRSIGIRAVRLVESFGAK